MSDVKYDKINGNVAFVEDIHKYFDVTNPDKKYISVTTLIEKYGQPFDSNFWSAYKALEKLLPKEVWALEKKSLFKQKNYTYVVYNDLDFLKQKESVMNKLISLSKKKTVVLVYDELPEKGNFKKVFEDYITIFNYVTDDIAIKYVNKANYKIGIDMANFPY